jgi:hypothetical protein
VEGDETARPRKLKATAPPFTPRPSAAWQKAGGAGDIARQRTGRALRTEIHAVADGAEWIWLQCNEVFGAKENFSAIFIM